MNCKFCNAPLEEDVTVCPVCGKELIEESAEVIEEVIPEEIVAAEEVTEAEAAEEIVSEEAFEGTSEDTAEEGGSETAEETPVKKKKTGKIVALVVGCVALAAIVLCAVLYGLGIDLTPRANDSMYKENYTVSDEAGEKASDTVIARVADKELTNAELQLYYWYSVDNYMSYYSSYLSYIGLDSTQPLEDQIYDAETGKTWQQFFLENCLETWHRYITLVLLSEDEGYTISEATQTTLDQMPAQLEEVAQTYLFENADEMIKSDWTAVCNVEGYQNYLETNLVSSDYYSYRYTQIQPTAEEVEANFTEKEEDFANIGITKDSGKYVDVRHILIKPEGGTTAEDGSTTIYSEEEWETCRTQAQALLDEWLAGDATEESFASMAVVNSQDGGSASNGGLYTDVTVGQMVEPFENWCFDESRQAGDTGLVQTDFGYHVMYFVGSDEIWYVNALSDLLSARTEEILVAGQERWPMEVNYKKIVLGDMYGTGETAQ